MVNKQFRITTDSLSPLYKSHIGFDRLFEEFANTTSLNVNSQGYPPYNISKGEDEVYTITLAIAGFKKSEIDIELEDGNLLITGNKEASEDEIEYLHKGIAERGFVRRIPNPNLNPDLEAHDRRLKNECNTIKLREEEE